MKRNYYEAKTIEVFNHVHITHAISRGHSPIFIHEDIREDHERNIAFSWIPMFSMIEPKIILGEMKMVNDYQAKGQGVC